MIRKLSLAEGMFPTKRSSATGRKPGHPHIATIFFSTSYTDRSQSWAGWGSNCVESTIKWPPITAPRVSTAMTLTYFRSCQQYHSSLSKGRGSGSRGILVPFLCYWDAIVAKSYTSHTIRSLVNRIFWHRISMSLRLMGGGPFLCWISSEL